MARITFHSAFLFCVVFLAVWTPQSVHGIGWGAQLQLEQERRELEAGHNGERDEVELSTPRDLSHMSNFIRTKHRKAAELQAQREHDEHERRREQEQQEQQQKDSMLQVQ